MLTCRTRIGCQESSFFASMLLCTLPTGCARNQETTDGRFSDTNLIGVVGSGACLGGFSLGWQMSDNYLSYQLTEQPHVPQAGTNFCIITFMYCPQQLRVGKVHQYPSILCPSTSVERKDQLKHDALDYRLMWRFVAC